MFATVVNVSVFIAQYCFAKGNARESAAQTDKVIRASQDNAAAATKFATSAEGIRAGVESAVSKLNTQATALTASATQASRLADDTEKANQNVVEADRPWMGAFVGVTDFEVDKVPTFTFVFTNSGRRPARIKLTAVRQNAYQTFPTDPTEEFIFDTVPSTLFVVPGQQSVSVIRGLSAISDTQMNLLLGGTVTYFAFANVEYTDARTNTPYWTHMCVKYFPKFKSATDSGWRNCPEYNDAK